VVKRAAATFLFLVIAAPARTSLTYRVDAAKSNFIVRALSGGLLGFLGHDHTIAIRDFSGEASVTAGALEPARLHMRIRADSLAVIDKVSQKDRLEIERTMREEVLEVSKYPEIVFNSTQVSATRLSEGRYQVKITGELTLHGVTRDVTVPAEVAFSEGQLRARGQFSLRQSDYRIAPPKVAGGAVRVKDELKLSFDILARQVQ
jgi:polyisoprenoid-binding protein YceI